MDAQNFNDNTYEAVIIGAGIGGLFAANYLALKGKRVLVIEKHITPGGYVCGFKRKNYYFDGANNSFSSHGTIFGLLKELGITDDIKFYQHKMWHVVDSANLKFKYESFDSFYNAVYEAFKSEPNIKKFLKVIKDFYNFFRVIEKFENPLLFSGLKKVECSLHYLSALFTHDLRSSLNAVIKYGRMSGEEFVGKFFSPSSEAYKFFRNYGNPNQNAIVLGAMISEFISDKWYPEGGEQNFANVLAKKAESRGVSFSYNTTVTKILTENGRAAGVQTNKGTIYARNVIIGSDYKTAFLKLLDNKSLLKNSFTQRLKKAEVSESLFTVYLGLKCDSSELQKRLDGNRMNYSRIIVPKDTVKMKDDPDFFKDITISIFSASAACPQINPKGYSSLTIQCLSPAGWMNDWCHTDKKKYQDLKGKAAKQVLEIFDMALPGLLDKAEVIESATPWTYERYTQNTRGAYCAWSWEPNKSFFNDLKIHVKTPVKNLYCCCDWSYKIGGMVSAMIAGRTIAKDYIK